MTIIYTLLLENGYYYVGKTNNLERRLQEHYLGNGSSWTKLHSPIECIDSFESNDNFQENITTKKLMHKYGIDKVRGGSYCSIILPNFQIQALKKEFAGDKDECFKCGEIGHFAEDCNININSNINPNINISYNDYNNVIMNDNNEDVIIIDTDDDINDNIPSNSFIQPVSHIYCLKCGRTNHTIHNCYARITRNGKPLENINNNNYNILSNYNNNNNIFYGKENTINHSNKVCLRCGRRNHTEQTCHAKTTIDGFAFHDYLDSYDYNINNSRNNTNIYSNEYCIQCGSTNHSIKNCNNNNSYSSIDEFDNMLNSYTCCTRCGRTNHFTQNCTEETTVTGFKFQ